MMTGMMLLPPDFLTLTNVPLTLTVKNASFQYLTSLSIAPGKRTTLADVL